MKEKEIFLVKRQCCFLFYFVFKKCVMSVDGCVTAEMTEL